MRKHATREYKATRADGISKFLNFQFQFSSPQPVEIRPCLKGVVKSLLRWSASELGSVILRSVAGSLKGSKFLKLQRQVIFVGSVVLPPKVGLQMKLHNNMMR